MPAIPVVFLYGLLIISGAVMVLYGLSQKPRRVSPGGLFDTPTTEALELEIKGSGAGIEAVAPAASIDPSEFAQMEYSESAPERSGGNFSACIERIRSQFRSSHRPESAGEASQAPDGDQSTSADVADIFDLEREGGKPLEEKASLSDHPEAAVEPAAAVASPAESLDAESPEAASIAVSSQMNETGSEESKAEPAAKKASPKEMTALDSGTGDQPSAASTEEPGDAAASTTTKA